MEAHLLKSKTIIKFVASKGIRKWLALHVKRGKVKLAFWAVSLKKVTFCKRYQT